MAVLWDTWVHPSVAKTLDINGQVFVFELALAEIEAGRLPTFTELSKYPETRRDLAVLIDQSVAVADVIEAVQKVAGEFQKGTTLFDVYQGEGIENGKKSLALGLTWQHPSRTLNDDEVNEAFEKVVTELQQTFSATLRS